MPPPALSKLVDIDDFASPELAPYLREVQRLASARLQPATDDIAPDAVVWQEAMALRALDAFGAAAPGRMVAGVGPLGAITFALARRRALVFAADRFFQRADSPNSASMFIDPSSYAPAPIPRGHVLAVHSLPTSLHLPSDSFDAVYSVGLIERLGSVCEVEATASEIGRILKPGGVAAIATEFRLEGPDDRPWFDDRVMLFTESALARHIVEPSGLVLRAPLSTRQSDATFETRQASADFEFRDDALRALARKHTLSPNLIVFHDGFLSCPVVLTLHKDVSGTVQDEADDSTRRTRADAENAALAATIDRLLQGGPNTSTRPPTGDPALQREIERLRGELDWLRAEYERSNAWKAWRVMRPARMIYRRFKHRRR